MPECLMINHGVGSPQNWDEYFTMLHENNFIIGGSALDPGISIKGGRVSEAETKTITGYILIRAESLEKAKEIMEMSPIHKAGGTVELFTLVKS